MKYSEMTDFLNKNKIYAMQPYIANIVDTYVDNVSEEEFEDICEAVFEKYQDICLDEKEPDIKALVKEEITNRSRIRIKDVIITRSIVEKALQCLEDNDISKDECPIVLQALCYILLDTEICELIKESDYD